MILNGDLSKLEIKRPSVGVGVIVVRDGKVLLGKRLNAHGTGRWAFPGGHLEFGESYGQCAKRETYEEAGISVKNVKFITASNDHFAAEGKHYVTAIVRAEYVAGEPLIKEPEKCELWSWFKWNELPQPLFLPIENLIKGGYNPFSEVYQHYKGNFYEKLSEGWDSESLQQVVVYRGQYNSPEFGDRPIWVRPKFMFEGNVVVDGIEKPRFKKLE